MGRSGARRRGAAVAVCAAAMTLVSGCAALSQDAQQETVLIGADLELSGAESALGNVYHEALKLRVDQVNQEGVLGNRRLELLVLDNRSDAATSATNLAELAGNDDVAAIITGGCDACPLAAVDTINNAGVPTIALAAASEITEPVTERPFLFQLGPDAADVAQVLAAELDRVEADTVGLVTTDDVYGQEAASEMERTAERIDVEVARAETVSTEEDNMEGVANAILSYQREPIFDPATQQQEQPPPGPDAVVMWVPGAAAEQLAIALRSRGYEGQLLLDPSAANEVFLSGEAAGALSGARMVFTETLVIDGVVATSPAKAARQNWFDDYTAQQSTYHAYSSFAADAVEVLVTAINRGGTDRASIRTTLENTQIDGLSGPIRFRLETHSGLSPQSLVVLVAQGDRWRLATS